MGVSLPVIAEEGVGVDERVISFSGDLASRAKSLTAYGVVGRFAAFSGDRSGDLSGDRDGEANKFPPSMKLLRSLTLPVWMECMRL